MMSSRYITHLSLTGGIVKGIFVSILLVLVMFCLTSQSQQQVVEITVNDIVMFTHDTERTKVIMTGYVKDKPLYQVIPKGSVISVTVK